MINDINGLKTQSISSPWLRPADAGVVADDPFGSDEALDAFLENWASTDTNSLDTLAQVSQAPVQAPALPTPAEDATWQLEHLVASNRKLLRETADKITARPAENAPSRLLMTDETPQFGTPSGPIFNDANAWKLFDQGR